MGECNKCGDCCEDITVDYVKVMEIYDWMTSGNAALLNYPDRNMIDAIFIKDNWYWNGRGSMTCSKFDTESRTCTIHNDRPPICVGFPWYGREPNASAIERYTNCSFREDIK